MPAEMNLFCDFFDEENSLLLAVASSGETQAVLAALGHSAPATGNPGEPGDFSLASAQDSRAASPGESLGDWQALHFPRFSLLQTGVGKANAAGAVARTLTHARASGKNYAGVLSFGIAGSLKQDSVKIAQTVFASKAVLADEGTPLINGCDWTSLERSGWAQTDFDTCLFSASNWAQYLQEKADHSGPIATVSTISGSDQIAADYFKRTGALAEAMEGAAIAQVCAKFELAFAELRVISNYCGNRDIHKLDIPASFKRLKELVSSWGFAESQGQL